jgi:polyisoprenoid-binding protein YceI
VEPPIAIGGKATCTYDVKAQERAHHRVGERDSAGIVSKDGEAKTFMNGGSAATIIEHTDTEPGHLRFQVEGGAMDFRNIRVRPEQGGIAGTHIREACVRQVAGIVAAAGLVMCNMGTSLVAQSGAGAKIELGEGTKARYVVAERLVGVDFGSDAVGTTEGITGTIVLKADGTIDASQSKITIDMKSFKSDQGLRDMFLQMSILETAKFPTLEFVPTKAVGIPFPLPQGTPIPNSPIVMPQAAGFDLVGDMTLHGVTKEVTWRVVSTISADEVSGRATTTVTFDTFGITKPAVPLLASVEDDIRLELEFRGKRSAM